MRLFSAITGALLLAFALPTAGWADGTSPPTPPVTPHCTCPPVHHVWHHRVRHWRHRRFVRRAPVVAPRPYWASNYNPLLPSPLDTAYDRAMTLHFRSAPVSGEFLTDRGYPPTPPVAGVAPYRVPAYAGVYQYDGLTGQYIRLAAGDAQRSGVAPPPPPPPPPAPTRP